MKSSNSKMFSASLPTILVIFALLINIEEISCMTQGGKEASSSGNKFGEETHKVQEMGSNVESINDNEVANLPLSGPRIEKSVEQCPKCGNREDFTREFDAAGNMVMEKREHNRQSGTEKGNPDFVMHRFWNQANKTRGTKLRYFDEEGRKLQPKTKYTFLTEKALAQRKMAEFDKKMTSILPNRVKKPNMVANLVDVDDKGNFVHKITHKTKFGTNGEMSSQSWNLHGDNGWVKKFTDPQKLNEHLDGMGDAGKELKIRSSAMEAIMREKGQKIGAKKQKKEQNEEVGEAETSEKLENFEGNEMEMVVKVKNEESPMEQSLRRRLEKLPLAEIDEGIDNQFEEQKELDKNKTE